MPAAPIAFPDPSRPELELSALEQAARIRDGSLTSQGLVAAYIERIVRHDGALGSFVYRRFDGAMQDAERMDRQRAKGRITGPFHGVPTALKDLHFLRGTPTRMGSRAFSWLWSPIDDTLAKTIKRDGFVILGKTATSELALLPIVETEAHPPSRNPWSPEHVSGGSSGGAGAAIAAGFVPVAPGSDGAGSIRIPSAINGLVGLKPTARLVPDDADRVDLFRMTTVGPMARSVDDAAALLDTLVRPKDRGFLERSRESVRPMKIGLLLEPPFGETDERIAALVRRAADVLRGAGHTIVERGRVPGTLEEFLPVYQAMFGRIPVLFPNRLAPIVQWFRDEGRKLPKGLAKARYDELHQRTVALLDGVDALIAPTTPVLPPRVGAFRDLPPRELFEAVAPLGSFTAASNLSGAPALSMPFGRVDGLPVGVQLIGRHGEDGRVLALGRLLENAAPAS